MKHLLDTRVGPYQAMIPMVDVDTIGAGGGSIAYVDQGGIYRVGPRSAGADPGPAAYDRGGAEPTATDAMVNLGWLQPEAFLGGGVANFLGTHWPVGDEAAFAFSTRFYQGLLDGAALGECVLEARRGVFAHGSIDWADYVHYGSPEFTIGAAEQA